MGHIQSSDVSHKIMCSDQSRVSEILKFVWFNHCIGLTVLLFPQVRSIVIDVRRTISVSNLEQFSLLQEFASIH